MGSKDSGWGIWEGGVGKSGSLVIWRLERRSTSQVSIIVVENGCCVCAYLPPTSSGESNEAQILTDCTWLNSDHDRDGTDGLDNTQAAAMQIHMQVYPYSLLPPPPPISPITPNRKLTIPHQAFTNLTSTYSTDPSYYCTSPTILFVRDYDYEFHLKWWEHTIPSRSRITFWKDHGFKRSSKRQPPPPHRRHTQRSLALRSKLVASTHEKHSAKTLCESETSHGPDFVSRKEGLFCDMETKKVWPVCDKEMEVEVECYDWGSHSLVTMEGKEGRGYVDVEEWV